MIRKLKKKIFLEARKKAVEAVEDIKWHPMVHVTNEEMQISTELNEKLDRIQEFIQQVFKS